MVELKMMFLSLLICLYSLSGVIAVDVTITSSNDIYPSSTMDYFMDINMTSTVATVTPSSTPSWVEEHLSLLIGVPTGIGLCLLMLIGCLVYCGISALYHSIRERRAAQGDSTFHGSGTGTRMTGVGGGTLPNASSAYSSSGYHPSYFEPSDDTLPRKPKHNEEPSEATSAF